MARTAIEVRKVLRNAGESAEAEVIAGSTGANGFIIPNADRDENLITVRNTGTVDADIVIKATDKFTGKNVGDLTLTVDAAQELAIMLESALYRQGDGSILIDAVAASGTGFTGSIDYLDTKGF